MPDPIRVTRAVRRCPLCGDKTDPDLRCTSSDCSDGWVDVPVDEECPTCRGRGEVHDKYLGPEKGWRMKQCGRCGGSGRRLHNWATGWCVGDEVRYDDSVGTVEGTFDRDWADDSWVIVTDRDIDGASCQEVVNWDDLTLVLSDDMSHRPEPMRWKQ